MSKRDDRTKEANLRCVAEHGKETVPDDFCEESCVWAVNEIDRLREQLRRAEAEVDEQKRRRVYYQDIVYAVCNILDSCWPATHTVCGTASEESREVQDSVAKLKADVERLRECLSGIATSDDESVRASGVCSVARAALHHNAPGPSCPTTSGLPPTPNDFAPRWRGKDSEPERSTPMQTTQRIPMPYTAKELNAVWCATERAYADRQIHLAEWVWDRAMEHAARRAEPERPEADAKLPHNTRGRALNHSKSSNSCLTVACLSWQAVLRSNAPLSPADREAIAAWLDWLDDQRSQCQRRADTLQDQIDGLECWGDGA